MHGLPSGLGFRTLAYQRLKESGWTLPQPVESKVPPSHGADEPDPRQDRPEGWLDGTPIYYPSPEDIEVLRRDIDRSSRNDPRKLTYEEWGEDVRARSRRLVLAHPPRFR